MRLLLKLNLVLLLTFGAGVAISGYVAHGFLQESAREQVLQQARLMADAAFATRTYTAEQITPLLARERAYRLRSFPPQMVAAYSAKEVFSALRAKESLYTYKEAALNPTELQDRALDWEADLIASFHDHPALKELTGERQAAEGPSLYLAHPLKMVPACEECHSTPRAAPPSMLRKYGSQHGFNWRLGDTIAAQIVTVPMALPVAIAKHAFRSLMMTLVGAALATFLLLDLFIIMVVIRPVTRLSAVAEEISKGALTVPELEVKGGDEVALLTRSFNRMVLSLAKAIKLLESK
jgi:HAMP domain-containing protein